MMCYFLACVKKLLQPVNANRSADQDTITSVASMTFTANTSRKISRDAAPHIDNYRTGYKTQHSLTRPTLPELYDPTGNGQVAVNWCSVFATSTDY